MSAACNGWFKVVRYLLDHGADMNYRNPQGFTALLLAFAGLMTDDRGHFVVVEILLQRGVDLPPIERSGKTFLLQAAAEGRSALVGLLLAHGRSDVDAMSWHGTGLFFACRKGYVEVVMQLLEAGADPAVQRTGANKQSPYEAAVENEHENVISILQDWDRAYMLTRARRVRDDVIEVLGANEGRSTHSAPAYLRGRATAMGSRDGDAVELPQVEVRENHGVCDEREGEAVAKRRDRKGEREDHGMSEASGDVVARHVLQELSGELFVELMGMCELFTDQASADAEDEWR